MSGEHKLPIGRRHHSYEPALLSAGYIATSTHDHPAHQGTGSPIPRLVDVLLHSLRRYHRTQDPLTRQMLAYARLIIQEALRHSGGGWAEYD